LRDSNVEPSENPDSCLIMPNEIARLRLTYHCNRWDLGSIYRAAYRHKIELWQHTSLSLFVAALGCKDVLFGHFQLRAGLQGHLDKLLKTQDPFFGGLRSPTVQREEKNTKEHQRNAVLEASFFCHRATLREVYRIRILGAYTALVGEFKELIFSYLGFRIGYGSIILYNNKALASKQVKCPDSNTIAWPAFPWRTGKTNEDQTLQKYSLAARLLAGHLRP